MQDPAVTNASQWKDTLDLGDRSEPDLRLSVDVPNARLQLEDCQAPESLHLDLHIHRSGIPGAYEYKFRGEASGDLGLRCVRCLADFTLHLTAPFEMRYLPISVLPLEEGDDEHEMLDGEVDIEYYRRPVFDLLSLVREQVYLALPMDPVCHEGCAGLCPHCGFDRNLGDHECTERPTNPVWQALRDLKLKEQKQ